ncbi:MULTISPECIES: hypothetical protein [unclassified Mycobacteroides]|uniref:hypothetical protein n=1 Tax=unclassified Mycobacteroides TaxID=2618759 RepID=UPI0013968347|nr:MULTISPECIES: hypothetical protein [unclassified Mycobacteroides]
MTEGQRVRPAVSTAKSAFAAVIIAGSALSLSAVAVADPVAPGPGPSTPDAAAAASEPLGPPPPPPPGGPQVPEIANPVYGSGTGSGPLGTIRDLWHQARDGNMEGAAGVQEGTVAPPPAGAGPAPKLPPGYISMTDPGSSTPRAPRDPYAGPAPSGPPLPPGYQSLNGPPPPGYEPTGPAPENPAP